MCVVGLICISVCANFDIRMGHDCDEQMDIIHAERYNVSTGMPTQSRCVLTHPHAQLSAHLPS
jgi:hypothetical protein